MLTNNYSCCLLSTSWRPGTPCGLIWAAACQMDGSVRFTGKEAGLWRVTAPKLLHLAASPSRWFPASSLGDGAPGWHARRMLVFSSAAKVMLKRSQPNIFLYICPEMIYTCTSKDCINTCAFCPKQSHYKSMVHWRWPRHSTCLCVFEWSPSSLSPGKAARILRWEAFAQKVIEKKNTSRTHREWLSGLIPWRHEAWPLINCR